MIMRVSGGLCLWSYVVVGSLLFVYGSVQAVEEDDWVDPYDMLNYDSTSKSMRKPTEVSSYSNVPTKRREYSQDSCQVAQCPDIKECTNKVKILQQEIDEHRRMITFSTQQPTCNPVFKRFLAKLLKEIEKLGLPSAVTPEMHYDAEVKLSKKMVLEIQKLVNDGNGWITGALDDSLSQILVNFKLHDYEAWKWRFEDTFGVELNTVIKITVIVLMIAVIICIEKWSKISWFVQIKRMIAICFIISVVWNWCYLYKIAFATHQANIVKMEDVNEKCTGVKKFDWRDNFVEWFRKTWTLQDDPCKKYYEVLIVNPILEVSPMKAIIMTLTTFITDPLKHLGQGISEFLLELLKDLPITLQIPVFILIGLSILVFMYSAGQAAVQLAVLGPLRGGRRGPPPGIAQNPAAPPIQEPEEDGEERDLLAGGDGSHAVQPRRRINQEGNQVHRRGDCTYQNDNRPEIHQRRSDRPRPEQRMVYVETLRDADSGNEADTRQEAVAEVLAQHVEEEPLTLSSGPKEGNETSASNTVMNHTEGSSKEHSAKSNTKDNQTSGNTERNKDIQEMPPRKTVENIGTPIQESMQ